jgi:hypothetical protein
LQGRGALSTSNNPLVDPNRSCLIWFGGNMPQNGFGTNAQGIADLKAWAAAGSPNN